MTSSTLLKFFNSISINLFRLAIHPATQHPFPDTFGYSAPVGFASSFGIKKVRVTPRRYSYPLSIIFPAKDRASLWLRRLHGGGAAAAGEQHLRGIRIQPRGTVGTMYLSRTDFLSLLSAYNKKSLQGCHRSCFQNRMITVCIFLLLFNYVFQL